MAGGRFLSGNDPTISPDPRVRASVGVGNDCEPYADFGFFINYPAILPNCTTVDRVLALGDPLVYQPIFDRIYVGPTSQIKVEAIGELERYNATLSSATLRGVDDQTALAVALINTGQLTLGPDAFQSPGARAALAAGLAAQAAGGQMASPFSFAGMGGPTLTTLPSTFNPFAGFSGGNLLDAVTGSLPSLATIAGQYFLQQQQLKAQEDAAKRQLELLRLQLMAQQTQMQPAMLGFAQGDPLGAILGGMSGMPLGQPGQGTTLPPIQGPSWIGVGAGCGQRGSVSVSPADAPGIYRTGGCSGALSTRSRFFALRADGTRDLFVKVGKVQSVSPRVLNRFARRWAKEAGLVAAKRGAGGRRGRRRPR